MYKVSTQGSQTTFKSNLTCIFLSARARYFVSNPDGGPCKKASYSVNSEEQVKMDLFCLKIRGRCQQNCSLTSLQTNIIREEIKKNVWEASYPVNSAQQVKMGSSHKSFFVVTLEEDAHVPINKCSQHFPSLFNPNSNKQTK